MTHGSQPAARASRARRTASSASRAQAGVMNVIRDMPEPFVVTDLIRLVILIAFPLLATWLPTRMKRRAWRVRRR